MENINLTDKNQLLGYLKFHGLWAKKGLSQNFLVDAHALEEIVEAAELKEDDFVIEIGPGIGVLTQELVKKAGSVISVELDARLAELLAARKDGLAYDSEILDSKQINNFQFQVLNADILKVNLDELTGDRKYKVVANIPYHITSKIFELFLSRENKPELLVLLVQKEVAERVCARAGDMSVLAVSVQLFGEPEIVDIVPKESFFPSPKVDSAILLIRTKKTDSNELSKEEEKLFFRIVHIGFSARRKTLVNNLMNGYKLERQKIIDIIESIGLKETVRAQELTVEQWKKLAKVINQ